MCLLILIEMLFTDLCYVFLIESLSTGYSANVKKHNETVDRNRHVLNKIIDCIKFCGVHEIPLRGHDEKDSAHNRGVFKVSFINS